MTTNTDNQLLSAYAVGGSEAAFRELVQRNVNMVHSAALREAAGNSPLAEDITQDVFTELARRAGKLAAHPALAGWLYTCVRLTAANVRRSEYRRQRREQEAFDMNEALGSNPADQLWREVRPVLDDAMHELEPEDRTAVVLRFFEGRSLKEVGMAIGLTENAARMRVERSLEKLHALLSRRGIKSTATTLAMVLVAGTAMTISSAFASTVAANAMSTVAATAAEAAGISPVGKAVAAAKAKLAVGIAVAAVVAAVVTGLLVRERSARVAATISPLVTATTDTATPPTAPPASRGIAPEPAAVVSASQMAFQLLDAESGEPLAGAKLHLFYLLPDGRGKTVHAVTDDKGQTVVEKPQAPYNALNFFVTADAHVPKVTAWNYRRPIPAAYTMKLDRGATVGGVVVDESGSPIAGATIDVQDAGNDQSKAENIQFSSDATITTGTNGQWACNMIPKDWGQPTLTVRDADHAETNFTVPPTAPDATKLVISMARGLSVAGSVQDFAGNPVHNAEVRQVRMNDQHERITSTDGSGNFALKGLTSGELTLAVQAEGYAPAVRTVELKENVPSLSFQLGPGQVFRGRIVDESGNPVTNAFIETTRLSFDKIKWSTNTDTEGRFEWNSATVEPVDYSVLAEGFARFYRHSFTADGSDHEIKLSRLQPGKELIQVTGTVSDAETAQPLDDFKVYTSELKPDWAFPLEFVSTGQAGKFGFSISAHADHPGYRVQVEKEGYLPATSGELAASNGSQQLTLKMYKGAGPSGVAL
jgi:RNA polymerase sigma factor (sigma-70 family)